LSNLLFFIFSSSCRKTAEITLSAPHAAANIPLFSSRSKKKWEKLEKWIMEN
jgi:hypothetical protein